jgi:hypothetical protein
MPRITTELVHQFQQLVDQRLFQRPPELPVQFSCPSLLVSVPGFAITCVAGALLGQGVPNCGRSNDCSA